MTYMDRIKMALIAKDMTQKELAARVGIREATICRYFASTRIIRSDILKKIADCLELSTDYILDTKAWRMTHSK